MKISIRFFWIFLMSASTFGSLGAWAGGGTARITMPPKTNCSPTATVCYFVARAFVSSSDPYLALKGTLHFNNGALMLLAVGSGTSTDPGNRSAGTFKLTASNSANVAVARSQAITPGSTDTAFTLLFRVRQKNIATDSSWIQFDNIATE